jgi:hypothetical protein
VVASQAWCWRCTSARRVSLRCRSAVMRPCCSWQRVRSRRGIITPGYCADLVGRVRVAASLVRVARIGKTGCRRAWWGTSGRRLDDGGCQRDRRAGCRMSATRGAARRRAAAAGLPVRGVVRPAQRLQHGRAVLGHPFRSDSSSLKIRRPLGWRADHLPWCADTMNS